MSRHRSTGGLYLVQAFFFRCSAASRLRWRNVLFLACIAGASAALFDAAAARTRHRAAEPENKKVEEPAPPTGPMFFVISLNRQHVSVYSGDGLYARSPVSTGRSGHPTPRGLFTIVGKERMHHSNLYSDAPMPFMQRITWSGIAMHEGVLPGYPASHGCIRLPHDFAKRMFGLTQGNERVIISRADIAPAPFAHPKLPAPALLPEPGPETISSISERILHNALATSTGDGAVEKVAAKAEEAAPAPDAGGQKLLNPHDFATAMKARAAKKAEEAAASASHARFDVVAKAKDVRAAAIELRKAQVKLDAEKDRLESAERRLKRAESDEAAVKAAEAAKADAEAKVRDAEALLETAQKENAESDADKPDLRKAKRELSDAKDRLESAERRLKRAEGDQEFVKIAEASKAEAEAKVKDAEALVDAAQKAKAQRDGDMAAAVKAVRDVQGAQAAAADGVKFWNRRLAPVSVFISRKTQRLYVRQKYAKVFDVAVTIRDPQKPLGTHLFLAMPPAKGSPTDAAKLRWLVLTVPEAASEADRSKRRHSRYYDEEDEDAPRIAPTTTAAAALDRIEVSPEAAGKISELLWTGATLIVSDSGVSSETDDDTDFVILTR